MRWFGESWGAPVCTPETHISSSMVGENCQACGEPFGPDDQGFEMPYLPDLSRDDAVCVYWHLDCLLRNVGVRK